MNLNKIFLLGNVARDPESRTTPSGQTVANFSIATNRMWTDKEGQKQKKAEFHNIVAWGKLGEICAQYLQKGKLVFIEGRVETRSWDAPDGTKKYKTEVIAEGMQMGPKLSGNSSDNRLSDEKQSSSGEEIPVIESDGEIEMKDIPF
ncbi:MAG: Single-stranded DNA-binding protein [Parcubacteria group bacterium GW2011_GWD2_38_12]|uniref:Single-stranded DNA-binding protein n=1 Tax=Candidatus Azambacteria bacterium RIFCSPLOWO2_01_FULL_37_9 TaxID=1797297 RepID=A0A1F5C8A2_9BACT|nr:MAG: Single-stranded DNA-binding protein [Parcubacteria group bacterium GW2011_GWC2_36_17]KKQ42751.1 MAG: Single-stranded DNA-binding protein [Parcubacteria group bacterium GW2011_GWE2_37_8]KKQ52931.1 MAG: Single-stranded DNA-binding protein [Parcubacteria group bacterium GW2011_GWD2_38_12]KKQ59136.1 MAG: Single-stranded DNA-binding protein [Parcubacteria group bacterium GW2011_GWC1_38_17]KKQ59749.1 MAG: Single-stranded DNA-binding protein [Parcubacteria group bacterium GW2011_GWD1_38_16]OG